jgi:membrane fusion protein, heavy metal efflux system
VRQQEQSKLGTASDQDLDQAKSNAAQAAAEYSRTRAHLKTLGVSADAKPGGRLLTVTAPVAGSITALSIAPGAIINGLEMFKNEGLAPDAGQRIGKFTDK